MTQAELDLLRARSIAVASQALLRFSVELIKGGSWPPEGRARSDVLKAIELRLCALGRELQFVTFEEMHSAQSDLWAGEVQDAFDLLSAEFLDMLRQQNPGIDGAAYSS